MNVRKMLSTITSTSAREVLGDLSEIDFSGPLFEVVVSDRPDLADYQCNAAMALAKVLRKNPREIANSIRTVMQEKLGTDGTVDVAGGGFINVKLSDQFLISSATQVISDARQGCDLCSEPQQVMIDFGGPNIAKELHVGHLRPHLIGDSLQRLMRFYGDAVTSDIHMGDWGTPIGMIITQLQYEQPGLDFFDDSVKQHSPFNMDIDELGALYRRSKEHWDSSDEFKDRARLATEVLQSGRLPGYRALWKHLRDVSLDDVKGIYRRLDISFDLWLGESDVNDMLPGMIEDLSSKGLAVTSNGAIIIPADLLGIENSPPLILQKGDGGYTYAATDLATIKDRVENRNANTILYVVDNRQSQHFQQVFAAAKLAGYAGADVTLVHVGHGTINGKDKRPFKTRDGQTIRLKDVLDIAYQKARAEMPEVGEQGATADEIEQISHQIGMGAVKFQECSNARNTDYVFDMDNFTSFDGKTGPYLQYAAVRCKALLKKAEDAKVNAGEITVTNKAERDLLLHLSRFPEAIEAAYSKREPNQIADHGYKLAQLFSGFYTCIPVLNEPDTTVRASRLQYVNAVYQQMSLCFSLLGIPDDLPPVF